MTFPKLFAFGGYRNSGKDLSATMLRYLLNSPKIFHNYWLYTKISKWFPGPFEITSFAKHLKLTLAAMLGISVDQFEDRVFKECEYINFSTLQRTRIFNYGTEDNVDIIYPKLEIIPDNKFSKALQANDFSFVKDRWLSMRQVLQLFGTNVIRHIFGDNFWILRTLSDDNPKIISDLRFIAEMNAIKERKGISFYMNRSIAKSGNHPSEREVSTLLETNQFDYIINNNGTKEDLFNTLKNIVWQIKKS